MIAALPPCFPITEQKMFEIVVNGQKVDVCQGTFAI
jgi:hypothetical protein